MDIICGGSVQRAILSLTGDSRCEKKRKRVRYNGLYEEAKTETASNGSITFLLIHLIIICAYIYKFLRLDRLEMWYRGRVEYKPRHSFEITVKAELTIFLFKNMPRN